MKFLKQHVAQFLDEVVRALKDKADACRDALRDATARLFPAPAVVPVDTRQRPPAGSSRPRRQ